MNRMYVVFLLSLVFCSAVQAKPTDDDIRSLGTEVWCYQLHGKAADAKTMAETASQHGVGSVCLKAHDGIKVFHDEPQVPAVAQAMHAKGIKVLVWGFNYASHLDDEAALIISYLEKPWCDGYIFNTEAPLLNKFKATEELVSRVKQHRDNCPICRNKLLGFAPYAYPSLHRGLNYKALVENTDFIEPQMYWATMDVSVEACVWRTYQEWLAWQKTNGVSRPIVPLGQTYSPSLSDLKASEITEFGKRTRGYLAVSYYVWPGKRTDWWHAIGLVARGRSSNWQQVSGDSEPLPAATAEKPWYTRWWGAWLAIYWLTAALLLLVVVIILTCQDDQNWRRWTATGGSVLAFCWPFLLAAALALLLLALAGLIGYLLYLAGKWGMGRQRLKQVKIGSSQP